jgi:translation initiation factor eIF-2B subunit gamma
MVVDSEASYANVNREILRYLERSEIAKNVKLGAKAAVNTSIVACNSSLGDRSSVKRSVMGPNCSIGASAKIVNSILHEGVTVGDGCQVHNSILCRGVTLVAKTSLKDCVVGPNCSVPGGNHKGEEFFDE